MLGQTTSNGVNINELKILTNWVNIIDQCSPYSKVDLVSSFFKVNDIIHEVHCRLCWQSGIPNQTNLLVIPQAYRPMSSWQNTGDGGYYGCQIITFPHQGSASSQTILINTAGGVRSSHSANAASSQPAYAEFSYKYAS